MGTDGKNRSFFDLFTLVEHGRVKNTFLLYSFAMSLLFLAVFLVLFWVLPGPIEQALAPFSTGWAGALEWIVPAILFVLFCLLCQKLARNKALAFAAFAFLAIFALVVLLYMLFSLEAPERKPFLGVYAMMVPLPLVLGALATGRVWYRDRTGKSGRGHAA